MNLTVILVKSRVSERVQQTFEAVVHVPPPIIRGIKLDVELYRTGVFRHPVGMEPGDDSFTVFSAVTRDQNSRSHVPVVVIHAGRPRQFQFQCHFLAHGGAEFAPLCGGGVAGLVAATPERDVRGP